MPEVPSPLNQNRPRARVSTIGDIRRVGLANGLPNGSPPANQPGASNALPTAPRIASDTFAPSTGLPNFLQPSPNAISLQTYSPVAPQKGLIGRFFDWLMNLLGLNPAPAPYPPTPPQPGPYPPQPQPQPNPPAPQPNPPAPQPNPPAPQPAPVDPQAGITPGVSVYFTHAYSGGINGKTNAQANAENLASTQADPNNPDKQLVRAIDAIPPGGTLDGAFFSIGVENVTNAIIRAAQRGVRVRLVTEKEYYFNPDGTTKRPMIQKLEAAGITVLPDERGGLMHDKFMVANGQSVWTGSYNITQGGSYQENNNAMNIASPELAAIFTREFEKMYVYRNFGVDTPNNGNPSDDHPLFRTAKLGSANVEVFFSPFMAAQRGSKQAILEEIAKAQKSVQFLAFSFHDDDIGNAMLAKARQGLKVEGVFEKSQAASRTSEYQKLNPEEANLGGRLDVRTDTNPALMHHKVIILDDSTLIMGSFNFSESAQSDNNENMLVFRNAPDLVAKYRAEFQRIQAISIN